MAKIIEFVPNRIAMIGAIKPFMIQKVDLRLYNDEQLAEIWKKLCKPIQNVINGLKGREFTYTVTE